MNGNHAAALNGLKTELDVVDAKTPKPCPLTDYQRAILQWAAKGKRDYDIAAIMGNTTEGAIQQHFYRIRDLLGCSTRISAVVMAVKAGWIE